MGRTCRSRRYKESRQGASNCRGSGGGETDSLLAGDNEVAEQSEA